MGNILILYDSATGNTKKMAHYVAAGAKKNKGMNVRLRHIDEATKADLVWCNGLAVGSPTTMGVLFIFRRMGRWFGTGMHVDPDCANELRISGLWSA
jgi:flavorubredoxin